VNRRALSVLISCFLLAMGCSKNATPPAGAAPPPTSAAAPPSRSTARVAGRVPPRPGLPVIIVLDPKPPHESPPQPEMPVMDQVALTFGPPLLFVRTNQPAEFRNSDDTLHNVHVTHEESREAQFNVAIPTGERFTYSFRREGFYHVGCDIHPAMSAAIFASSSPYVTLAADDGSFVLEDVPGGSYAVTVYAGETRTEREITVGGATTTNVVIE
jgi:hypothetical protein